MPPCRFAVGAEAVKQSNQDTLSFFAHPQLLKIPPSHSPSILGRIEPDHVRYFKGNEDSDTSEVLRIPLPENKDSDDAYKYVREAIRGYPELYFARCVVLGEGPSEELILQRVFSEGGHNIDNHFISVVPLGGRHVNHFWRLLHGLGIPYVTLLDYDREKDGAGFGRIQYVVNQLISLHGKNSDVISDDNGGYLSDEAYASIGSTSEELQDSAQQWLEFLERKHDVFFSYPLDIDLLMLTAFQEEYLSLAPKNGGPRMPKQESEDFEEELQKRVEAVLGQADKNKTPGYTYSPELKQLFPWYKYTFVDGSKPVNHLRVLALLDGKDLWEKCPEVLKRIVSRVSKKHLEDPIEEECILPQMNGNPQALTT